MDEHHGPGGPTTTSIPWQDRAQRLPRSSHVTASEQFVTGLRAAEFPNVTRKNILKNSKYFKLQLFRDQPSGRILERMWIQTEGHTSLSHPSWARSAHLLCSRYHLTVWSWFVTTTPSLSPQIHFCTYWPPQPPPHSSWDPGPPTSIGVHHSGLHSGLTWSKGRLSCLAATCPSRGDCSGY